MLKKTFLILSACSLLLFSCSKKYETLEDLHETPDHLTQQVKDGQAYLIDVRTPKEFQEGHLNNALNIDFKSPEFKTKINQLDKSKPVYLYCEKGGRSKKATDSLKTYGFTHPHSIGGLKDLKAQGLK